MAKKITVGDKVILTKSVSINHFVPHGRSITGTVVRVDEGNWVGHSHRPLLIKFDDRDGEWGYGRDEVRRI